MAKLVENIVNKSYNAIFRSSQAHPVNECIKDFHRVFLGFQTNIASFPQCNF